MITFDSAFAAGSFRLDVRFESPGDGITALFGPSGAGKSMVLALVAGALRPDRGRIAIGDDVLIDTASGRFVPLEARRIGWVFQDARLFPHLDVERNLLFGRRRRGAAAQGRLSPERVIDALGIRALLGRWPRDLSGGERQRVAIGRAVLSAPRLLLLDEPLASLDDPRRLEILALLERVRDEFGVPMLYVTHALPEVLRLADHLVLLESGRCLASGPATEVVGRVDTPLLSTRRDAGSLLVGRTLQRETDGMVRVELAPGAELLVQSGDARAGDALRIYVRANEVIIATEPPRGISVRNILPATVRRLRTEATVGPVTLLELQIGSQTMLASVTPSAAAELGLEAGRPVFALVKAAALAPPRGLEA